MRTNKILFSAVLGVPLLLCGYLSAIAQNESKPSVIVRGVTTDGKGDLGYGSFNGFVPDLDELPARVRDSQARAYERDGRGLPSTASGWANRGLTAARNGEYDQAAQAFARSSELYDAKGDPNTAIVMRIQSDRYRTELKLFYNRKATPAQLRRYDTGRRLEPIYGTYIGAFIDRDEELTDSFPDGNRIFKNCAEFNEKIGRKHAAFFTYNGYGTEIPARWFANLRENQAAAQWVIEPKNLNEIQDDSRLHTLAEAARDAGIPIFVRFASEMNGSWTPYHSPAALYKEKFRLVARVFHQIAPNVAMVWCPNNMPETSIADYYPGEEATDWVGINFYSPYFNNNDPRRMVAWRNPADNLDYIYTKYADKHPILIGEWAATHRARTDGVTRSDFAVNKVGQLYAAIPRKYPRVKAVYWFNMNAIKFAGDPGRRLNDYSLLSEPEIATQYRAMVSDNYFLDTTPLGTRATTTEEVAALADQTTVSGKITLSALAKTYEERPEVTYTVGGTVKKSFTIPGAYSWTLDTTDLPDGPTPISVTIRDSRGRVAATQTVTVMVRNNTSAKPTPKPAPPSAPKHKKKDKPAPIVKQTSSKTKNSAKPFPKPTPKPKPLPTPPPKPTQVSLEAAMEAASVDPSRIAITRTPEGTPLTLSDKIRFRVKVGADGYLFLILRGSDNATILLQPRRKSLGGGDLSAARVENGDIVSVPSDPNRALRPDAAGTFTIRALLFTTPEAARAFAATFAGETAPDAVQLQARLEAAQISSADTVYVAETTLDIVGGRSVLRGSRDKEWSEIP